MERIKSEVIKFSGRDIENLIKKHLIEVEKITPVGNNSSNRFDITWQNDFNKGATIVEVSARCAVATVPLDEL